MIINQKYTDKVIDKQFMSLKGSLWSLCTEAKASVHKLHKSSLQAHKTVYLRPHQCIFVINERGYIWVIKNNSKGRHEFQPFIQDY